MFLSWKKEVWQRMFNVGLKGQVRVVLTPRAVTEEEKMKGVSFQYNELTWRAEGG